VLLHLVGAAQWRTALDAGTLVDAAFVTGGFIHLSRPDQVAAVAERLFRGRQDLVVLVVDPARLRDEVRWEPGVAEDPTSMRFPHLYGPLPVAAVTSVLPYRPAPDGTFAPPTGIPPIGDPFARAIAFERSVAERRAAAVVPVEGGVACLDPRVPASWEHNSLWLDRDVDAATIEAEADRALAAFAHRRVVTLTPPPADLGWDVEELRIQVLDRAARVPTTSGRVVAVTQEVMAGLWAPSWRRDHPGIGADAVDDLVRRESFADAHARIVDLAVLDGDAVPIAGTQLRIDGATAAIEAVMTAPSARRQGHGAALVGDAVRRARAAGCDVIWLMSRADDWPRHWYERIGFVDVGCRWEAVRSRDHDVAKATAEGSR
jgi:uncharacterized protein (DUF952 family)/ribosomal protein S18 acetylase RimI-like enzyme